MKNDMLSSTAMPIRTTTIDNHYSTTVESDDEEEANNNILKISQALKSTTQNLSNDNNNMIYSISPTSSSSSSSSPNNETIANASCISAITFEENSIFYLSGSYLSANNTSLFHPQDNNNNNKKKKSNNLYSKLESNDPSSSFHGENIDTNKLKICIPKMNVIDKDKNVNQEYHGEFNNQPILLSKMGRHTMNEPTLLNTVNVMTTATSTITTGKTTTQQLQSLAFINCNNGNGHHDQEQIHGSNSLQQKSSERMNHLLHVSTSTSTTSGSLFSRIMNGLSQQEEPYADSMILQVEKCTPTLENIVEEYDDFKDDDHCDDEQRQTNPKLVQSLQDEKDFMIDKLCDSDAISNIMETKNEEQNNLRNICSNKHYSDNDHNTEYKSTERDKHSYNKEKHNSSFQSIQPNVTTETTTEMTYSSSSLSPSNIIDEWREVEDTTTGKTYYYNRRTRESRWYLPENAVLSCKKKKRRASTCSGSSISVNTVTNHKSSPFMTKDCTYDEKVDSQNEEREKSHQSFPHSIIYDYGSRDFQGMNIVKLEPKKLYSSPKNELLVRKNQYFFVDDSKDEIQPDGIETQLNTFSTLVDKRQEDDVPSKKNINEDHSDISSQTYCLFCRKSFDSVPLLIPHLRYCYQSVQNVYPQKGAELHMIINELIEISGYQTDKSLNQFETRIYDRHINHFDNKENIDPQSLEQTHMNLANYCNSRPLVVPTDSSNYHHYDVEEEDKVNKYDSRIESANVINIDGNESLDFGDNEQEYYHVDVTTSADLITLCIDDPSSDKYDLNDEETSPIHSNCPFCLYSFQRGHHLSSHLLKCKARKKSSKNRSMPKPSQSWGNTCNSHSGRHLPGYPKLSTKTRVSNQENKRRNSCL